MKWFAIIILSALFPLVAHAQEVRPDEIKAPEPVEPPPPAEPAPVAPEPVAPEPEATPAPVEPEPEPVLEALPALPPLAPTPEPGAIRDGGISRNFAGSVQLDYLALARGITPAEKVFAGATLELSLKLAMDLGEHVTANVKVCYSCHGFEVGMAYFDIRANDAFNVRVGRFTPAFGNFPIRHDPANHITSDKPLAYDMGRMVRFREWNEGILPAPYVDNGVEINGTHQWGRSQVDYAVYAINGPKGNANNFDFDFTQSRSGEAYYVDNNSQPTLGARTAINIDLARTYNVSIGGSGMAGHYDPEGELGFVIAGGDVTVQLDKTIVRAEYVARWTQFAIGDNPVGRFKYGPAANGEYSDYMFKDGFDFEAERSFGRVTAIARFDGLRRRGNVLAGNPLSNNSRVYRYTAGAMVRIAAAMGVKASLERYDFNDFEDDTAIHLGIAGPF